MVSISCDFVPNIFAKDVILGNIASQSFKSVVICTNSYSEKSNSNFKVSPTWSAGSDKYYAFKWKEMYNFQFMKSLI